jgi:hypothetical protein
MKRIKKAAWGRAARNVDLQEYYRRPLERSSPFHTKLRCTGGRPANRMRRKHSDLEGRR